MLDRTHSDFRRIAVSAVGALLSSTLCIGGAVAPAQAAAAVPAATMAGWTKTLSARIDAELTAPAALVRQATRNAQIGVTVDRDGQVSAARILQSSGSRRLDRALLRRADALVLTPLPADQPAARPLVLRIALRDADRWAAVRWPVAAEYAAR